MSDKAVIPEDLTALMRRARAAFEPIANVCEGDEQRILRCVDRALRSHTAGRLPRRKHRPIWLAAALVLVTSSGLAWWSQSHFLGHHKVKVHHDRVSAGAEHRPAPRALRVAGRSELLPSMTPPMSSSVSAERVMVNPPSEATPGRGSATELLTRANLARKSGLITEAIQLYAELQDGFPGSVEARLSHVSLGRLQLSRGRATSALREFDRYLRVGGPLTEEALVGKAHSLGALGQLDAQRATYAELLQRFPRSVYQAEARARLAERSEEQ